MKYRNDEEIYLNCEVLTHSSESRNIDLVTLTNFQDWPNQPNNERYEANFNMNLFPNRVRHKRSLRF